MMLKSSWYLYFQGDGPLCIRGTYWETPSSSAWVNPDTFDVTHFGTLEEARDARKNISKMRTNAFKKKLRIIKVTRTRGLKKLLQHLLRDPHPNGWRNVLKDILEQM